MTPILQTLNLCLRHRLTAINQLFLHARMARNWGLGQFNEYEYRRSLRAMKLADGLIERILFLEGLPSLQDLGKLLIGEDVPETLAGDLQVQGGIRADRPGGIERCEAVQDVVSREVLEKILHETEEHIDWIEGQQRLIDHTGLQNHLQSQMGDDG